MSSDLRFDQSWSLSLAEQPDLIGVPQYRIRHDKDFGQQFYLHSTSGNTQPAKALGVFAQAVASDDGKSVTLHIILKKQIPSCDSSKNAPSTQFWIDEVACKLYLIFRGIPKDKHGEHYFQLAVLDLSFGRPDSFGHRRVSVIEGKGQMFRIKFGESMVKGQDFFLCPNTGQILFCLICDPGMDASKTNLHMNGTLELDKLSSNRTIQANVLEQFYSDSVPFPFGHSFSSKGQRLAVFNFSAFYMLPNPTDGLDRRSILQLCSVDKQFKVERQLYFDHYALAKKLYPKALLTHLKLGLKDTFRHQICEKTLLWGRIFKYTIFSCFGGVAVAKHFERWIADHLCDRRAPRVSFLGYGEPNLFLPQATGPVKIITVVGTMLYYNLYGNVGYEKKVQRLELGIYLKDYRKCAYCATTETKKRRNAQGERMANFKVCRDCKKLNLHHQWWKFSCHFCSDVCMKKGWKEHKKIHKMKR